MRALVARDLADAGIAGLSADRRFATAYNAALQAAHMAIACAGYRVTAKTGHHKVALDSVTLTVGDDRQRRWWTDRRTCRSRLAFRLHEPARRCRATRPRDDMRP